jgi:hypothetical protein
MRKTKLITALLLPLIFLLNFCFKQPFAKITLHGQVIDSKTQQPPFHAELSLWAGCDPNVACQDANNFGKTQTNADGTFEIKSKAQTNGSHYFLLILTKDSLGFSNGTKMSVDIPKNQTTDLGVIKF